MSLPARSADADPANTIVKGNFTIDRDIRGFVLPRHNLTTAATVRLQLYSDTAWNTQVYDSTALDAWSIFYPPGALNWGHPDLWTGALSEEDRLGFKFDFLHVLSDQVVCKSFKVSISDAANPDGHVEFTRCFLAPGWQPERNMQYGAGVQWNDPSVIDRSPYSGVKWIDKRTKYRSLTGKLHTMTTAQGVGAWFEMQRRLGITEEFYYVFDPADEYQAMKLRSFMATFQDLNPLDHPYFNKTAGDFAIEEVL
jgi:hypothetical protein